MCSLVKVFFFFNSDYVDSQIQFNIMKLFKDGFDLAKQWHGMCICTLFIDASVYLLKMYLVIILVMDFVKFVFCYVMDILSLTVQT